MFAGPFLLLPLRFRGFEVQQRRKNLGTLRPLSVSSCFFTDYNFQSIVATMSSRKSRSGKHSWSKKYHRIARKNKLQIITEAIHEEEEGQEEVDVALPAAKRGPKSERNRLVREYKARILCALARSEGDSSSAEVHAAIDQLLVNQSSSSHFDPKGVIAAHADRLEDSGLSLSKPVFKGCLGLNENNEPMYTLGRMAFGTYLQYGSILSLTRSLVVFTCCTRRH